MERYDAVIQNGQIWNGTSFLEGLGSVAVRNGEMAAIGLSGAWEAPLVINAGGGIITPGLLDTHVHLKGCSEDIYGVPGEMVCFPAGVTTAVDAGTMQETGKPVVDQMLLTTYGFLAPEIRNNQADFARIEELLEVYGDWVLGLKVFFDETSGQIKDLRPLRQVCDYARKRGLKVLVHTTGTPVPMDLVLETLAPGDICTHIFHGGNHTVEEDSFRCLEKARARGVILDAGMAGGGHTDFQVAKHAIAAGVLPDTISTDITKGSAFVRGGNYSLTMCMSILKELGMSEEQIFSGVTSAAAESIGKVDCCGILEVGRNADLAVISYGQNPFDILDRAGNRVSSENGYRCCLTMKAGQVVYRQL